MKIVIVGGGISGFAAYLALRKHLPQPPGGDHEYTIYEAYDTDETTTFRERTKHDTHSSTLIVGGGLGVAPNGLHVLERLDSDLLHEVVQEGYMVDHSNLKSKHGHLLMRLSSSGICPSSQTSNDRSPMHLLGISRHALWRSLRRRIPNATIVNKRVSSVTANPNAPNTITFTDGSPPVSADLVIGADGLKSIVKRALFPETDEDPYPPHYEGLVGIGGFLPSTAIHPLLPPGSMNFLFSGNGFFGYFYAHSTPSAPHRSSPHHISPPGDTLAWWSTYSIPSPPSPQTINPSTITQDLRTRYASWTDPIVKTILPTLTVETVWPMWTSPPLPTWDRDGIVLIGDAAHTLPTTSGQGSSQALEDAEALSLFLAHYLHQTYKTDTHVSEKEALKLATKKYTDFREPRVREILDRAQTIQNTKRDVGVFWEWVMYLGMWVVGFFPAWVGRWQRRVFDYDLPGEVERVLREGGG
ncbi:putative extracellular salicylate hydroxylase/monooxygenase [Aspergillus sclerotiicarbonarius CBS 121057]|uniref:Putative extracellular salicylate hydroxylase/monooxygenase n=1 Tax=Aspergillus sclerotiicarbonarius (strain CBS 121057 / IBT 28362) TaxID=1448318 RepID=A0A319EIN5_ASPSB|nr:putative extracellular salicylate hydroxylase/monooxygenase [Aspergillus sclerotiicarbonarius CBS 121057]